MSPPRLLIVEDEDHLRTALQLNFELEGYAVEAAGTARAAAAKLLDPPGFDAIVLDVQLPDRSGFELCRHLRSAGDYTPVLMLTARGAPTDRVDGLEAGADDYLVKPFELDELLARVRSLLRRQQWNQPAAAPAPTGETLAFGRARVDFATHEVTVDGRPVVLTRLELDLVRYFAEHPGRVIPREELLEKVWKLRNYAQSRTVDNFIVRLRRHFEVDPASPVHFVSARGTGYKFVP